MQYYKISEHWKDKMILKSFKEKQWLRIRIVWNSPMETLAAKRKCSAAFRNLETWCPAWIVTASQSIKHWCRERDSKTYTFPCLRKLPWLYSTKGIDQKERERARDMRFWKKDTPHKGGVKGVHWIVVKGIPKMWTVQLSRELSVQARADEKALGEERPSTIEQ